MIRVTVTAVALVLVSNIFSPVLAQNKGRVSGAERRLINLLSNISNPFLPSECKRNIEGVNYVLVGCETSEGNSISVPECVPDENLVSLDENEYLSTVIPPECES